MQCFHHQVRWRLDKQGRHFFQLFWCASVLRTLVIAYGFRSLKPRLHKAPGVVVTTSAGTGRTRSASPGRRPAATAGGATPGAS